VDTADVSLHSLECNEEPCRPFVGSYSQLKNIIYIYIYIYMLTPPP